MTTQLEQAWEIAKQRYAAVGVDVEEALRQLDRLPSPCTAGRVTTSPVSKTRREA
ncbi:hypothetical protein G7B21_10150 [Klebsiella pneumoniae]|nr:hypothetical protein [Klebsiella pneumoniae]